MDMRCGDEDVDTQDIGQDDGCDGIDDDGRYSDCAGYEGRFCVSGFCVGGFWWTDFGGGFWW